MTKLPTLPTHDGYLEIYQVNEQIRDALDGQVGFVRIKGEIASFTKHHTGHIYFSLKDSRAQIDGVVFKNLVKPEFLKLKIGDFVYALGTVTSYIKTGKISFQTYYISAQGQGNIHYDLTLLKETLEKEGLFLSQKQFTIPEILTKLVVITSLNGAALKDFLSLITERTVGNVEITIIPTLMQGEQTASSVILSLKAAQKIKDQQVVLITRGGGAYEDLWSFNDENLVRFIAKYPLPVLSAIGHEQDYTLTDFVCAQRYATPSAAAYSLFSYRQKIQDKLDTFIHLFIQNLVHTLDRFSLHLEVVKEQLQQSLYTKLQQKELQLEYLGKTLKQLNPESIFKKGYAVILTKNSKPFVPDTPIQLGDKLILQTLHSKIEVQVTQK